MLFRMRCAAASHGHLQPGPHDAPLAGLSKGVSKPDVACWPGHHQAPLICRAMDGTSPMTCAPPSSARAAAPEAGNKAKGVEATFSCIIGI